MPSDNRHTTDRRRNEAETVRVVRVGRRTDGDAALEAAIGRVCGVPTSIIPCRDDDGAITQLVAMPVDLVLVGAEACDGRPEWFLRALREAGYRGTVIATVAERGGFDAARLVQSGADGFVVDGAADDAMLCATLEEAAMRANNRHANAALERWAARLESLAKALATSNTELAVAARVDGLTGILNRSAWLDVAQHEHDAATSEVSTYAVLLIDIDQFKRLNDCVGHAAGDECLRLVAAAIQNACRTGDSVARFGGEEFVVLMPRIGHADAVARADRVRQEIRDLGIMHGGFDPPQPLTVSIGVAIGPWPDLETVIHAADHAMYEAKAAGRDQVRGAGDAVRPSFPVRLIG